MVVEYYKALWGMGGLSTPAALEKIRLADYDGIEAPLGALPPIADRHGLKAIGMAFPDTVDELRQTIDEAATAEIVTLNVHAGRDWMSFQDGCEFFEAALELVEGAPIPVLFETHRGRLLSNPWSTAAYLRKFPQLRLTADFSHWTCVCSSMLGDQTESLELAIAATDLIHARVGHEEGPQVPDPRVPAWQNHVETFEGWWDAIRDAHVARGATVLRVDPEFGPPNYLWTDPRDGRPLADLFDVCTWMRDHLKHRWG